MPPPLGRHECLVLVTGSFAPRHRTPRRIRWGQLVSRWCLERLRTRVSLDFMDSETVRVLKCKHCGNELSSRAMCVVLLADHKVKLFSSDMSNKRVLEGPTTHTAPKCQCVLRSTFCAECKAEVGYHVVEACVFCLEADSDNGHYWLFPVDAVKAAKRRDEDGHVMKWSEMAHNDSQSSKNRPTVYAQPVAPQLECRICCQLLHEPVCCKCGHTFCRGCIEHEIDMRNKCPLDRQVLTKAEMIPNLVLQDVLDSLLVHCSYGLRKRPVPPDVQTSRKGAPDEELWEPDPNGCQETMPVTMRQLHEAKCPFRQALSPEPRSVAGIPPAAQEPAEEPPLRSPKRQRTEGT